jgi:hypothetical protein
MIRIPSSAFALGFAGLIPFIWGALMSLGYFNSANGNAALALPGDGPLLLVRYGGIILPFMSGVLWGFATNASGPRAFAAYGLSIVPALWWFFAPGTDAPSALINLMTGFGGLLILDFAYQRWGLAPNWWMTLRVPLTVIVLICLGIGAWT